MPDSVYVISIEEILWGGLLMAITMAIHGFGMLLVLRLNNKVNSRLVSKKGLIIGMAPVILASCMILVVHLIEVMLWSGFFLWKGAFPNQSLAFYFSLNEYTTVGSQFSLPQHWRLLEGMIATAGLLAFAWSTGVLITLAQKFQDQQMELLKQRHQKNRLKKE
jgi:voltage-gated potassium channel